MLYPNKRLNEWVNCAFAWFDNQYAAGQTNNSGFSWNRSKKKVHKKRILEEKGRKAEWKREREKKPFLLCVFHDYDCVFGCMCGR